VNGLQAETAIIIVGVLAAVPHAVAAAMLLSGRWKIITPNRPTPPTSPAAATADVAPVAAAVPEDSLRAAA
jgi:hypothetical protein